MPVRAAPAACAMLCACMTASAQTTPLPMALCAGWQGERVCELLHEDAQMRVLRCTFPPGVGHEPHYHPPHFGYVLEGSPDPTLLEPESIPLVRYKRSRSWWKLW